MIPFYLKDHLTEVKEKPDKTTGILISSTGNTDLEILFYGDLLPIRKVPYITDGEFPCLIAAKDPLTGEIFPVFDGLRHGYDAMFCNEPAGQAKRELRPYEFHRGRMKITFGYAIDYEEERESYTFNAQNEVKLADGSFLDFRQAKSIGFDWLSIRFTDIRKTFVDLELA